MSELESEVIKAIPEIRKKGKNTWLYTILLHFKKESISSDNEKIAHAIPGLLQNGKIEERVKMEKRHIFYENLRN